jgi:hypothetical protein
MSWNFFSVSTIELTPWLLLAAIHANCPLEQTLQGSAPAAMKHLSGTATPGFAVEKSGEGPATCCSRRRGPGIVGEAQRH